MQGDAVGDTLYYGRGAGDMPTGSAVVSDVVDIGKKIVRSQESGVRSKSSPDSTLRLKVKGIEDIEAMYYFRFTAFDKPGVLSSISGCSAVTT